MKFNIIICWILIYIKLPFKDLLSLKIFSLFIHSYNFFLVHTEGYFMQHHSEQEGMRGAIKAGSWSKTALNENSV